MKKKFSNVFSVDAETDGLYGAVWAVGATLYDEEGREIDRFGGMVDPSKLVLRDEWVKENVLPHVNLETYDSHRSLRDAFWAFWVKNRDGATAIADVGSPVESGLFRACVEDDPSERIWSGPYPLHEVATALLCAGVDPDIDRIEYSGVDPSAVRKHNPVDDAIVSAQCWFRAFNTLSS